VAIKHHMNVESLSNYVQVGFWLLNKTIIFTRRQG